jgi:hypothetical protein
MATEPEHSSDSRGRPGFEPPAAVATIWLVFYLLIAAVTIVTPSIPALLQVARLF